MSDSAFTLLESITQRIHADFGLRAHVATEIEFYLIGSAHRPDISNILSAIHDACIRNAIKVQNVEKERGAEQYEIALAPSSDPVLIAENTQRLKTLIADICAPHGMDASFSAKPFEAEPGSGLHIHLHLEDAQGRNAFFKKDDTMSDALRYALGGMLALLKPSQAFFAPHRASYARFAAGCNVPITVSWGANNRTVAIRLPTKPSPNKHIEHRVSGADADPALAIAAVLAGVHYGLTEKLSPGAQIYGDASLPLYALEKLHTDVHEAMSDLLSNPVLATYMGHEFIKAYAQQLSV